MRIISRKALRKFWEKYPDAHQPLQSWYIDVKHSNWKKPADIKSIYQTASFVSNNRVVFNVKGNQYRIIVVVEYRRGSVYIRFVGTHSEYNHIDATKI
jgi:mRNA interferase HigB